MADYKDKMADYVDVAERIRLFRAAHPEGSLQPADMAIPYRIEYIETKAFIVYIAAAYRHPADERPGIGSAWEPFPGKTPYTAGSELMNAESSAWGRAIVAALAADTKKIATIDEIAARRDEQRPAPRPTGAQSRPQPANDDEAPINPAGVPLASEGQRKMIWAISKAVGKLPPANLDTISKVGAMKLIDELKELQQATAPIEDNAPEESF